MRWLLFCLLSVISLPPKGAHGEEVVRVASSRMQCGYYKYFNLSSCANYLHSASQSLDNGRTNELEDVERNVARAYVFEPTSLSAGYFFVWRYSTPLYSPFEGLDFCASESEVNVRECNASSEVQVQLTAEVPVRPWHNIALIMVSLPPPAASALVNSPHYLLNNRMIGLSVSYKRISGLQEFVNISMNIPINITANHSVSLRPQCVFLDYTTHKLDTDGCRTQWEPGQSQVVCSCDHLTFFAVLMTHALDDPFYTNYLRNVSQSLETGRISELEDFERTVVRANVSEPTSLSAGYFLVWLYPTTFPFEGLDICASESEVNVKECNASSEVQVQLPSELAVDHQHKFAFIMVSLPPPAASALENSTHFLLNNRLISLNVEDRSISGLQEFVNISINITANHSVSLRPQCVFLDYTTHKLDTDGCRTQWEPGQSQVVCSCDHLTFFAVLMISNNVPPEADVTNNVTILTYITFVGCSVSVCALLTAVLLITVTRNVQSDSMKIHVNLAVALLLLNVHFLPSSASGIWGLSWSSRWLCFYFAIALHFSLLASFCWMAVEAFNLYLIVVKVFDNHVSKYLLKASLVGWGLPVVVVGTVASMRADLYDSELTSPGMCYIREGVAKYFTTMGPFCLVFLFNFIILVVAVRKIVGLHKSQQSGPGDCSRAMKETCSLLGLITFLGTTWGLIFFSFGHLSIVGEYAFCLLNPLQGLFISLRFWMFVAKMRKATRTETETQH